MQTQCANKHCIKKCNVLKALKSYNFASACTFLRGCCRPCSGIDSSMEKKKHPAECSANVHEYVSMSLQCCTTIPIAFNLNSI